MGGIMYRTENLNKSYADGDGVCYALKDVNLDISKGQIGGNLLGLSRGAENQRF